MKSIILAIMLIMASESHRCQDENIEYWYPDPIGVVIGCSESGWIKEYRHSVIDIQPIDMYIKPESSNDIIYLITEWSDDPRLYSVAAEPIMVREPPDTKWISLIEKTWKCDDC